MSKDFSAFCAAFLGLIFSFVSTVPNFGDVFVLIGQLWFIAGFIILCFKEDK